MAELEIHHEHGDDSDPTGKKVGVLAAILAVLLAIVTIASHRAHTEGILLKTEANDKWQYYQSKSLKSHNLELGEDLIGLLATKSEHADKVHKKYQTEIGRYAEERKEILEKASEKEKEATHAEHQALRFDVGEGMLEIGLVLSSLYFISRKMLFPVIGIIAGIMGTAAAITGLFIH